MTTAYEDSVKAELKEAILKESNTLRESARMAGKLDAFRVVFEKTDRILSGHPIRVVMATNPPYNLVNAPGWTDGETISLNAREISAQFGKLTLPMIVLYAKAINWHELAHCMYSPRQRDDLVKWIIKEIEQNGYDRLYWYAYNALEDQRIEMMFGARFRPSTPYFETIVLKWLTKNGAHVAEAFILMHGRKFLPTDLIGKTRDAFVAKFSEELARQFEACIDEYLDVIYPSDCLRAQRLIIRFRKLMASMEAMSGVSCPTPTLPSDDNGGADGPNGKSDVTVIGKNSAKVRDQKAANDAADSIEPRNSGEADDDEDDDDEDGDDASDYAGNDSLSGQNRPGDSDRAPSSSTDQSSQQNRSDGPDDSASPQGSPAIGSSSDPNAVAMDAVEQALEELFNDDGFMKELNDTAAAIRSVAEGEGMAQGVDIASTFVPLRPELIAAAKKSENILKRMRSELEESRDRRQTAGMIDPRRFQQRKPWETDFFTQWHPGSDEQADLEAVIICDLSGSMGSFMTPLSEALWATKRALEALDSRVTVLGFSETSFVMYQPTEKVERTQMRLFGQRGSTIPDAALKEAHRLLTKTTRTQRLLISITDGDWQGNEQQQRAIVQTLNDMDVVTCLIAIGMAPSLTHDHTIFQKMDGISKLPDIALKIVMEALKQLVSG